MDSFLAHSPFLPMLNTIALSFVFAFSLFHTFRSTPPHLSKLNSPLLLCLTLLLLSNSYREYLSHHFSLVASTFDILQLISFASLLFTYIIHHSLKVRLIALTGSGLALLLQIASYCFYQSSPTYAHATLSSSFHAAIAFVGYGALGLLAITSALFLLQDYSLSKKKFQGFFKLLPPLTQLSSLNSRLLLIGTSCLALSIIMGLLTLFEESKSISTSKFFISWSTFLAYTALFLKKLKHQLSPKITASLSIFLFLTLLLTLKLVQSHS